MKQDWRDAEIDRLQGELLEMARISKPGSLRNGWNVKYRNGCKFIDGTAAIVNFGTIMQLAAMRNVMHRDHESSRPLSYDYELVGLAGEVEFSRIYGYPVDLRVDSRGDNGIDFFTDVGSVDVKTARKAFNLIVENGKVEADIYILAQYHDDKRTATLVGWDWGFNIAKWPTRTFGHGILNHYKAAKDLKGMDSLPVGVYSN